MKCLGIDGCTGGWICAVLEGKELEFYRYTTMGELMAAQGVFTVCLIDMPIGLQSHAGQLRPDNAARKYIPERASTIFPVPCRQAVYADTIADAYLENERTLGKKFTPLTVGILPKIKQVDIFLQENPTYKNRLLESHPEVCFRALAGGTLLSKKKTPAGQADRLSVLEKYCSGIQSIDFLFLARQLKCGIDDIIDAACLAVSAIIIADGHFFTLPEIPQTDDRGLFMQLTVPKPEAVHTTKTC